MKFNMAKIMFLIFTIAYFFQPLAHSCPVADIQKYQVHVVNLLPRNSAPLTLHCASGDDDFGFHNLTKYNEDYHWSFCESIFRNTLFFCHLWWENKNIAFDVFSSSLKNDNLLNLWGVKSDGIYFADDHAFSHLRKVYNW